MTENRALLLPRTDQCDDIAQTLWMPHVLKAKYIFYSNCIQLPCRDQKAPT